MLIIMKIKRKEGRAKSGFRTFNTLAKSNDILV